MKPVAGILPTATSSTFKSITTITMEEGKGYDIPYSPWDLMEYGNNVSKLRIDMRALCYLSPPKALDHITCPICKLPFIEPWSTVCGHTFCKECIFESFTSVLGEKCPLDRVELKISNTIRKQLHGSDSIVAELNEESQYYDGEDGEEQANSNDVDDLDIYPAPIILSNITDDLTVSCVNAARGCAWKGERWSIKTHVIEKCEYTRVLCKCGKLCERRLLVANNLLEKSYQGIFRVPRKSTDSLGSVGSGADASGGEFTFDGEQDANGAGNGENSNEDTNTKIWTQKSRDGLDTCPHSETTCPECEQSVRIMDLDQHLHQECEKNLIKCSGCHLFFPVMYLNNHKKNCQHVYVDCPGIKYGCTWKGQRELLDDIHKPECVFLKMEAYLNSVEDRLTTLTTENDSLKLQMSTILDSVVQGKIHNLGYPLGLEEVDKDQEPNSSSIQPIELFAGGAFPERTGISLTGVKRMVKELERNRDTTMALVEDNLSLREQLNNQRAMILSLQQQMQFLMIERRRMFTTATSNAANNHGDMKLSTKL